MTAAPLVIFAVGNPSRGDDAIGPLLCQRLAAWLAAEGLAEQCELIEDFQLQVEHSLDLCHRQLTLFIDAGSNTPAPYAFYPIEPTAGFAHSTHALTPPAVLQVYRQIEGSAPPPAFVLCVRGEHFEIGADLSAAAESHAVAAFGLLTELCRRPEAAIWMTHVTRSAASAKEPDGCPVG
ncbi:MAG: hydrogenase maturation protease [Azonexus sp.]|jgi:hydrogenase maturation protease|nr:hydrogenase maturation protease [Azonexus sp.]